MPSPLALVSVYSSYYIFYELLKISIMNTEITQCLSCSNSASYCWHCIKLVYLQVNYFNGSEVLLYPWINLKKYHTSPRNYYTYWILVSLGDSIKLYTLVSLKYMLSSVMSNLKKVVILHQAKESCTSLACSTLYAYASVQGFCSKVHSAFLLYYYRGGCHLGILPPPYPACPQTGYLLFLWVL